MEERNPKANNFNLDASDGYGKYQPLFLVILAVIILVALMILIMRGREESAGMPLVAESARVLTESDRLSVLDKLGVSTASAVDRQEIVEDLSASAPAVSFEEKQKILNNLVGK